MWFVTAYERDVPPAVWQGIKGGFVFDKRFPALLPLGTVHVYRCDLEGAP